MEAIAAAIEEAQKQYRERLEYHRQQSAATGSNHIESDLLEESSKRSHVSCFKTFPPLICPTKVLMLVLLIRQIHCLTV